MVRLATALALVACLAAPAARAQARPAAPHVAARVDGVSVRLAVRAAGARRVLVWRALAGRRFARRPRWTRRGGRRVIRDHAVAGTTYRYRARAMGRDGRLSRASRTVTVRVDPRPAPAATPPPVTPPPAMPPALPATPAWPPAPGPTILFQDGFDGPDGLITNEFAYWNPADSRSVVSPDWRTESGSLLRRGGRAWTGVPDDQAPDPCSCVHTNSAVLRAWTTAKYDDLTLGLDVTPNAYTSTPTTPPEAYDGVHLFLRRVTEYELYYVSVARRDGAAVIKKKVPGGTTNGGTYYTLASRSGAGIPVGATRRVTATIRTQPDGSVRIDASIDGVPVVSAVDDGIGGPPITSAGSVGMRADNVDAEFDDLVVVGAG